MTALTKTAKQAVLSKTGTNTYESLKNYIKVFRFMMANMIFWPVD